MSIQRTLAAATAIGCLSVLLACGSKPADDVEAPASDPPPAPTASLPPELLETPWQLQSFGVVGDEDPALPDTVVTLTLETDGIVRGSTGCNAFSTTYVSDGSSTLTLRAMATTEKMCPGAIMNQESEVALALATVETFEANEDELLIFYDDGNSVLVFERGTEETATD